jgi:L-lactate dehydrogenase complex protein LldG
MKRPHELMGIDVAILGGEFGVAENGAVWVPGENLGRQRAVFVICEHLVLVLPAGQIVHTMQHAYERIRFERPGFGLFIAGPSKTADIEQSLVIGAHGPRSCTLFLVG